MTYIRKTKDDITELWVKECYKFKFNYLSFFIAEFIAEGIPFHMWFGEEERVFKELEHEFEILYKLDPELADQYMSELVDELLPVIKGALVEITFDEVYRKKKDDIC